MSGAGPERSAGEAGRGGGSRPFLMVAGGGTAGHVLPGLAVAEELVARGHPRRSIVFLGGRHGPEAELVARAGFPMTVLRGRGIRRSLAPADVLANLEAGAELVRGTATGVGLVRLARPRVMLILGGYASVPGALGGRLAGVPMVVAEQNARAGAASRLASALGAVAVVPFAETDLARKVVTGNPVRGAIASVDRSRDRGEARAVLGLPEDRVVIAAFSGSLGSRAMNQALRAAVTGAWATRDDLAVYHVTGRRDWDELAELPSLPVGGLHYRAVPYEDRMDRLLAAADLAVSRAGGTTVAELALVGLPAVLVPLPGAPRDHQTANAGALVRAGAARLLPERELHRLAAEVEAIVGTPGRLDSMAAAAAALGRRDAAERVADLIEAEAAARG